MSVACAAEVCGRFLWEATLRTSPSSGQATTIPLLRNRMLPACHSGAALERQSAYSHNIAQFSLLTHIYSQISGRWDQEFKSCPLREVS
jgi:hypothetical protein